MSTISDYLHAVSVRSGIEPPDLLRWGAVLVAEFFLVSGYFLVSDSSVSELRYVLYPFIWINIGALAVSRTRLPSSRRRVRAVAMILAGTYLFVLLTLGGLLQTGLFQPLEHGTAFSVSMATPGWGPIVLYRNSVIQTIVVPFKLVGYLSITVLLYARLLDATKGVLSGVLGLVTCVGCSFSILLPLLGASTFSAVAWLSWDLSTLVFVVTIGLLYWSEELGTALGSRVPWKMPGG